ncbi:NAD(P)-binding domain-containing protein [Sinomicrobium sp. M5D2P9]
MTIGIIGSGQVGKALAKKLVNAGYPVILSNSRGVESLHPRDLFDIKYLMENEGFTDEIKKGFLLCLLGSNRPLHKMLNPNLTDQRHAMENHFAGMSYVPFTYEDFEKTRHQLITAVKECLTKEDKDFLLGFKSLTPDWSVYNFERFPAVQWKLQNLIKLKNNNQSKYDELVEILKNVLY